MKKKILTCLVMLVCIVTLAVGVHATEVYEEISTPAQLYALMQANDATTLGKNYKLTADIDMSGYTAAQQSPIGDVTDGAFAGHFDGAGHFITGINISTTTKRTGLFGWASGATIENLTVSGKITSTLDGVGGIVGCAGLEAGKTTTIRNCVNYCTVTCTRTGETARVGGIAGVCSANNKKNVTIVVENCINYGTISGYKHIGGILGRIDDVGTTATGSASVTGCANFGTVVTTTQNVNADGIGGIVGTVLPRNSTYTVANCYNSGAVTGPYRVGGVVGSVATYASTTGKVDIKDCVNVGDIELTYVSGSEGALGGILGEVFNNGSGAVTIENCFVSGTLTSSRTDKGANTGAILGRSADHKGTLTYSNNGNCYDADMQFVTTGTGTANKTGGVTVTDLADVDAYPTTFNANDTFLFGEDGPILAAAHTHVLKLNETTKKSVCAICEEELLTVTEKDNAYWLNLATADDLLLLMANSKAGNADALSYNYILTKNVDLGNHPAQYPIGQPEASASSPKNKAHFTGKFDGNNKTISGILLENNLHGLGLFATVGGGLDGNGGVAVIKNLTVEGIFSGNRFVGAVVGLVFGNAEITNCETTAKTVVTASGASAGGVVGAVVYNVTAYDDYTYTATVRNCVNNGMVNSTSATSRIGGVVGQVSMHTRTGCLATIDGCINYGKITGGVEVGGISGRLEGVNSFVEIKNCLNVGAVEAVNRVGGIVAYAYTSTSGQMNVSVKDCVNIAAVSVTDGYTRDGAVQAEAAGIVSIANGTSIANCINAGAINGKTFGRVGGIVSYAGGTTEVKNCLNMANLTGGAETSAIVGYIKATKCDILNCTYMEGITGDPDSDAVTSVIATAAKNVLMTWCIYHGPKADAEDITKSTHTFGDDNKCIVCGAEPHANHEGSAKYVENEEVRIDATCKEDGTKFLFCDKCYVAKTETIPKAHLFEWNLTDLDFGCRTCDDDFEQNVSVEEAKNLTTIYVSDDGVAGNNGTDASHPLDSFATAMDVAAALGNAYGHEMTIKLVGNVTLARRQYSAVNTHALSFEETKHDYPITITSADVNNKGTLRFSDDAYYYFLYGDTTFKDMQFGALDRVGTKSGDSDASNIFARGFSLTMDTGLEMLSNSQDISVPKTNAGVDGLGATVSIPDVKLYVFGGFQATGYYDGEAGKNNTAARTADSNLTILSGKYWTIAGANRGGGLNTYSEKTVNITLGAIETTYICPLTSDTANAVKNVTVNIHYTDTYKAAYDYRFHFNEDSYGAGGTVNRFYHKDAAGSSVGDFSLGQAKAADAEHEININVNMYYATEMQGEKVITGYTGKHDRYAEVAHQTGEILPFPEWCVKYGVNGDGKHDYVNDVCSFCDLKKCTGSDHYLIWDAETGSATCIADCKETIKISEYSAIYVSDTGRAGATGLSKDDPLSSFAMAMDLAAKAGKDFTVYLVGTVTPMARQIDKTYNTFTNSFEESEHTNTITITSVSTSSKGTLHFTNACRRYFMYGPTTFKNIKISCDVTNGIYLFARGHKLVMDTGIVMVDVKGKTTSEKLDADISGLGATVETSDVKMYLYGGFYAETDKDDAGVEYVAKQGLYPGADPEKYDADITVKSGTYWTICGLNRGFLNTHTMDDTTVKMELQNVTAYVVCPTSTDPAAFKNVDAEVHYKGKVNTAFTYRFSYSSNSASADGGTNTVDHFFYKGYNGSAVGDFGVGAKLVKANVNMYYATALKDNAVILGYQIKDERYAAAYQQTTEILPFPEWCIKYAGGHDLGNDDICDFCEITVCTTHPDSEWIVTAEATCSAVGHEVRRCITCLTVLEERDTAIVADAHAAEWDYTDPAKAVYKCTLCQKVLAEKTYADYTAATALYVSSNAAAGGTGLASDSPINDFATAMELAAKSANDVTIYILDIAVLADNGPVSDYNDYVEPTHSNNITITSVSGVNGVLRFGNANAGSLMTMIYHLSGPGYTKFENIEISSWSAVARMNIAARHNKLIFGEGVTADWHRGDNSSRASSDLIVIGGCYGVNSCGTTCNGDCSTLGTDMELYSGNLGAIVGGGYLSGNCCKTGTIKLTLGDISVRRDITAGNYGSDAQSGATGNIVITIDGNISVGESFMFGPMGKYYVRDSEGKKTQDSEGNDITARYTAQDVTIVIKDGSLINGSFQAINSAMPVHTLGQSAADETVFDRVNTVTVYTDPNCPKAMTVYEHVRDALESVDPSLATDASGNLRYSFKWLEAYCKTNNGQHTNNGTGVAADKNIPATCLSDGLQAYQCLDCGKTYYESIPALGHKFTDASGNPIPKTSMAATCIAPEMTKQECQTCRASIYEVVGSSLPLDGTLYTHHSDPEKTGTCQLCGKDLTAICAARPGGHSFGVSTPITSGCATGTRRVCGDCGYVDVTLTSIGDGHNYGKYTVTKEPTATEAGIKTRTCKGCGKVDTALINASGDAINAGALATDASGNLVGFDIESSKLSRVEKAALNALLQENAYGSEVKVSYETDGESVTGITYNIPVPAEYTTYKNVMVVVKDEDGNLHFVDFAVEKGYIVFKF